MENKNLKPLDSDFFEDIIQDFITEYPNEGFENYSFDENVYFLMQEAIDRRLKK